MAEPGLTENLKKALAILRTGNASQAEAFVVNAAHDAAARFGDRSPEHAAAQFDLGCFYIGVQDVVGAGMALRKACDIPASTPDDIKARLTYTMNYGDMLILSGQLDEAERVLREALSQRQEFYGISHAGYAYGLEPLAKVLFKKGDPKGAMRLINQALNIFWAEKHFRTAAVLAIRAPIMKAAFGDDKPTFEGLDELPPEIVEEIAKESNMLAMQEDSRFMLPSLKDLRKFMERRNLTNSQAFFQLVASISNVARTLHDNSTRIEFAQWLVGAFGRRGDGQNALNATLALAMAHGEAGDNGNAEITYRDAVNRAEKLGNPREVSQAKRNFGLFLSEKGKRGEAEPVLEGAVATARQAGDKVMLGRALVALGIFIQHEKKLKEAKRMLDEAVSLLPPTEADILYALSHLNAIEVGGSCGCGDMSGAFSGVLRMLVMKKVPPGFLKDIHITIKANAPPDVKAELTRKPTQQEMEMLNRIIRQGLNLIRSAITRQGFSP